MSYIVECLGWNIQIWNVIQPNKLISESVLDLKFNRFPYDFTYLVQLKKIPNSVVIQYIFCIAIYFTAFISIYYWHFWSILCNIFDYFFQETEPRPLINDSSTSNEEKNIERYGQVNPGYVSSRPNSLYSHANNVPQSITDYEASRPPSALTSYSNFHGQRRPAVTGGGFQKPPAGKELCTNLLFCVYLGYLSLVFCSRRRAATHLQPNLYHYLEWKDISSLLG